jgi:hypothetical protein
VAGAATEPGSSKQLRRHCRYRLARHTGQEEAEAQRHLFGCLSVLIMRDNAALFTNRIPDHLQPEINGEE